MWKTAMKIEDASISHLDRLYEIERECFEKEAFAKKQIARLLTEYDSISLVAKQNDKIEGFIITTINVGRKTMNGHILTLDVSPNHRREGIGQRLLQEIEEILKRKNVETCHLEVREDNTSAIGLYEKMGYRKIGKLENYYGKANGLYFVKNLT
jgi:ribosomal-protein-alanine N-acetyltransferase